MTSYVAKLVGKKILGETLQNKFGTEDPYFEQVPATRLDGRPTGKTKKRKKALPPGISENDGKVLTKAKRRAYRLDMCLFSFLGVRFGWGSAIGLIPAIGDVLDAFMALMVLKSCTQIDGGLPNGLKARMMLNIMFDFVIGLVPFAGDLVDAVFRANTRNVVLLEEHLRKQGQKQLRQSGLPIPEADPSSPIEFDRWLQESAHEHPSHPPSREHSSQGHDRRPEGHPDGHAEVRPVSPVPPAEARTRESRGWLGSKRKRPEDVERAEGGSQSHPSSVPKPSKSKRTGRQ